jgi:hypothetical protein
MVELITQLLSSGCELCKSLARAIAECLLPFSGPHALTEICANEPLLLLKAVVISSPSAFAIQLLVKTIDRLPRHITSRFDDLTIDGNEDGACTD